MRGARSGPAAEQNIEADGEINQPDDAQTLVGTPVGSLQVDNHRRIQCRPVAGDRVIGCFVDAGQSNTYSSRNTQEQGPVLLRLLAEAIE